MELQNNLERFLEGCLENPKANLFSEFIKKRDEYNGMRLQSPALLKKFSTFPEKTKHTPLLYSFALLFNYLLQGNQINFEEMTHKNILLLVNCTLLLIRKLPGTTLREHLISHFRKISLVLLKREGLSGDDKALIEEYLEKDEYRAYKMIETHEEADKIEEINFYCKSKHIEDKCCGLNKLLDFFSYTSGFVEQLEIFSRKVGTILKNLITEPYNKEDKKQKHLLYELSVLLNVIIPEHEFHIRIKKSFVSDPPKLDSNNIRKFVHISDGKAVEPLNSNDSFVIKYKLANYEEIMKKYEKIYTNVALIVNYLLLFPKDYITLSLTVGVLQRLFKMFPKFRKNLEEPILTFFTNLNNEESGQYKITSSIFLYKLLNVEETGASKNYQDSIKKRTTFISLYNTPIYKKYSELKDPIKVETIDFSSCILRSFFPVEEKIPAGKSIHIIREAFVPGSILYIGFALNSHDIKCSIKLIALLEEIQVANSGSTKSLEEPIEICSQVYNVSKEPARILIFIRYPGLYKIEFDNTYSWIKEKQLRYRAIILEPANPGDLQNEIQSFGEGEIKGFEKSLKSKKKLKCETLFNEEGIKFGIFLSKGNLSFILKNYERKFESDFSYPFAQFEKDKFIKKLGEVLKKSISIGEAERVDASISALLVYERKYMKDFITKAGREMGKSSKESETILEEILGYKEVLEAFFHSRIQYHICDTSIFFLYHKLLREKTLNLEEGSLIFNLSGNYLHLESFILKYGEDDIELKNISHFLSLKSHEGNEILTDFENKFEQCSNDWLKSLELLVVFVLNVTLIFRNVKTLVFYINEKEGDSQKEGDLKRLEERVQALAASNEMPEDVRNVTFDVSVFSIHNDKLFCI